jgi:hypothetical protein
MHLMGRFGEIVILLATAMVLVCCEGPDDAEDAGPQEDADTIVDADADPEPEDASIDADEPVVDADPEPEPEDADVEVEQDPREVLALCLNDIGAMLYGAYWCGACRNQRYQFAPYHELINYVDCYFDPEVGILDYPKDECADVVLMDEERGEVPLEAFPTWTFDENPHYDYWVGTATFEMLAEMSGCEWLGEPTE